MVRFLALAAIAVMVAGLGTLGYTYRAHRPVLVADAFIAALARGDVSQAYGMTAAPWRARTRPDGATRELRGIALEGAGKASWPQRSINEEAATLKGRIKMPGSKARDVRVRLLKEDGVWRVLALEPL